MENLKKDIALTLQQAIALKEFQLETILNLLELPPSKELGDIAFPAFKLAPHFKKDPKEIAAEIAGKLNFGPPVMKVKAVGPYINFFLSKELIAEELLKQVIKQKNNFGENTVFAGKKILLEYSQPNTNKPLHIGHLRNNALAMSASFLLEKSGAKVTKVDLYNDRGIHVCQSMLAYNKWGKGKTPQKAKMKPDHFVGKYYVLYNRKEKKMPSLKKELTKMLQKWEQQDKKTLALWKKMNTWAVDGFKKTYKEFGSKFDKTYRESAIYKKAKPIIRAGLKKGVFERDEKGTVVADLTKFGLGKKTILRQDGTSIYITQDLALAAQKAKDFKFDKSLYVVASEQKTYFQQLFKVLELLGFFWSDKLVHLSYGLVNLPEGKLKSREGKIVDADTLILSLTALAKKEIEKRHKGLPKKEIEKRAKAIGLGAIKFYLLKTDTAKNVLFDPKKAISFEGDSGPYVMYTLARAKSILRKARPPEKFCSALLSHESEKLLVILLNQFESVVEESAKDFAPNKLCTYLLELSSAFNSFYHKTPVLKAQNDARNARVALVQVVAIVLSNGLKLLNIQPLEQM